jgi:hypothetical protein
MAANAPTTITNVMNSAAKRFFLFSIGFSPPLAIEKALEIPPRVPEVDGLDQASGEN